MAVLLTIPMATGCSTTGKVGLDSGNPVYSSKSAAPTTTKASVKNKIVVDGIELEHTEFDIPIVVNTYVEKWVDYFTGRGRVYFLIYLQRSKYFIPYITPTLEDNSVPKDLVYLAMIESGFNNHAYSRASAVGPWQFISATGKRYGLKVNWWLDERRDIKRSTEAAISYLKDLYNMFGSWELAAAAYNAGEAKVARSLERYGTADFWALSRTRYFKPETRNYVPKMMAAAIVAKNYKQFGFTDEEVAGEPSPEDEITAQEAIEMEKLMNLLDEEGRELASDKVNDRELASATAELHSAAKPFVDKKGKVGGEDKIVRVEVPSPADLLNIARAAGMSYERVKNLNPAIRRWCTPPHSNKFEVMIPASAKERFLAAYNHPAFPREINFRAYAVKKGDTLKRIARRFGIAVEPITDLNGISSDRNLKLGKTIYLPIPNDKTRKLSSLDLGDPPSKKHRHHRTKYRTKHSYKVSLRTEKEI